MNKKQAQKLLNLADDLRLVPPEQFIMRVWRSLTSRTIRAKSPTGECGFAGCAIGWYCALHPTAKLKFYRGGSEIILGSDEEYPLTGYEAIAEYFGVTTHIAHYLFSPAFYDDAMGYSDILPAQVADRIDEVVLDHGYEW